MDLESALKNVSKKIWNELKPCIGDKFVIHSVREEALSVMGLKVLCNSNCVNILRIEMVGAKTESVEGYDYEICIGSAEEKKFVRFFIQAKRLNGNKLNSRYKAYDPEQSIKLEEYSKKYNGIPLYALYNHLDVPSQELIEYYNSCGQFNRKNLGVTLATTTKLKGGTKFESIHNRNIGIDKYYRLPFYRYSPYDLQFYEDDIQVGVPLHQLANFTIAKAEEFNTRFQKNQSKNILPFFFFFFDTDWLGDENEQLIPILRKNVDELVDDFKIRADIGVSKDDYRPKALIILQEQGLFE